jgi:hypothetical protein
MEIKSLNMAKPSFLRRQESSQQHRLGAAIKDKMLRIFYWIPAFAGMTASPFKI